MNVDTVPKILLVDDEPFVLKSLKEILTLNRYAISTAGNGNEAIDLLRRDEFDLCLVDLIMPGLSGQDVMAYIKAHRLNTAIVVVSGDSHIDAAISALSHGASAFIKKPFQPDELVETVDKALKKNFLIRQKMELNEKIKSSERLHRFLSKSSPDFIYLLNTSGEFIYVNDRVESLLGYRRAELVGKHYSFVVFEEDLGLAQHTFDERRTGDRATRNLPIRLKHKNGPEGVTADGIRMVHVELNSMGIYSNLEIGTRSRQGSLGVAREITPAGRRITGVEFAAYHDVLTGLPNRLLLHDRLTVALDNARRRGHLLVVMFIDLDGFKEINDSMGHASGDKVLKVVANRLKDELRKADTLARYGGDEFILMLPQIDSLVQVETIAKKVLTTVGKPIMNNGKNVAVSASVGISVFPGDGDTEESLIGCADSAMYEVKNRKKGGYQFYSESKSSPFSQPPVKKLALVDALESNQFVVFYQPLFDREYERVIGLEALFRWHHPKKGLIFPAEILPEARRTGATPLIDEWVFDKVREDYSEMLRDGIGDLKLFLNLSVEKFTGPDFGDWLAGVLSGNRSFAESLHIEIPSEVFRNPDATWMEKFDRIRSLGVKAVIEIDRQDELRRIPLQDYGIYGLKIDVSGLDPSEKSRLGDYFKGFNGLLQRKGMNLIAKKVDFELDPSKYWPMEFNLVQGFLYYHPLPLQIVKSVIKNIRNI